jgi:predicted dehydrogenase
VERVVWQATDFFRTESYYRASAWRGTYRGEGGGVLVNQAPHVFDTLVWLLGKPKRVLGSCRFGRFHEIEVEDDVTAELRFATGATALVVVATGEAPGTNRLEISGDRGRIVIEGGSALIHRNRELASQFRTRESCGRPLSDVERLELERGPATASLLLANFVQAIAKAEPIAAPAAEAASAVEVANAVLWSSWLERPIELPLDALGFERALAIRAGEGSERALSRVGGVVRSASLDL